MCSAELGSRPARVNRCPIDDAMSPTSASASSTEPRHYVRQSTDPDVVPAHVRAHSCVQVTYVLYRTYNCDRYGDAVCLRTTAIFLTEAASHLFQRCFATQFAFKIAMSRQEAAPYPSSHQGG